MSKTALPPAWKQLQETLGYTFKDSYLLREAMTHPSYLDDVDFAGNNQRLEFLGDSILGHLVAERLFREFGGLAEGAMSMIKAAIVSEKVLAEVAFDLRLDECLRMSYALKKNKNKDSMLADAFEALLAALYLDGGWELAQEFRDRHYWHIAYPMFSQAQVVDYKSNLLRLAQAHALPQPTYEELSRTGPSHAPLFEIGVIWNGSQLCTGRGSSKKAASVEAARIALGILQREQG